MTISHVKQSLRTLILVATISVGWLGVILLGGCADPPAETAVIELPPAEPDVVRLGPSALEVAKIRLGEAQTATLQSVFRVTGRVTVNENATSRVGSFSEGVVVDCCQSVGTFVKKGQVLARLHSHEVHDAEADHRRAHEQVQRARAEVEYAEQTRRRASRLHELKAGTEQQLQEADKDLRGAEASLGTALAELRRAEGHLRYLGLNPPDLDHQGETPPVESHEESHDAHLLEIRSPIAGTIIERPVSQGAVVSPSATLYVISDLSQLWIIAQVPEQHLASMRPGMMAKVSVAAYPDRTFSARVEQIDDRLDPDTRTVQVRCAIANPGRELKTEMFVTLALASGDGGSAIVVPASAVQQVDDRHIVFIPAGQGVYRAREVEIGMQSGEQVEILQGLSAGDEVVVSGSFSLKSELLKDQMIEE